MSVRIQREDFDTGKEIDALVGARDDVGAVVSFSGRARSRNAGKNVDVLEIEYYPGMTRTEIEKIVAQAKSRWSLQDALVIHRHGRLQPGDNIVLVLTLAEHRGDAFHAAEFLMDYLKTRAPFWKQEGAEEGSHWVEARQSDDEAADRWSKTE